MCISAADLHYVINLILDISITDLETTNRYGLSTQRVSLRFVNGVLNLCFKS